MYFSTKFNKFKNLKHCFFSKKGGVSIGIFNSLTCGPGSSDNQENILNNLSIVSKQMKVQNKNFFLMNQTHSNKVVVIDEENRDNQRINSDALVTKLHNIAISVLAADCVPILIYEEVNQIIGCIHSGWRGAMSGVIENTLNQIITMGEKNKIYIAVGPCIGINNYKVGKEFFDRFIKEDKANRKFFFLSKEGKIFFDLRKYVNFKINKFNVECIENIDFDTFSNKENFFSYRRSKQMGEKDYGRCISTISLNDI